MRPHAQVAHSRNRQTDRRCHSLRVKTVLKTEWEQGQHQRSLRIVVSILTPAQHEPRRRGACVPPAGLDKASVIFSGLLVRRFSPMPLLGAHFLNIYPSREGCLDMETHIPTTQAVFQFAMWTAMLMAMLSDLLLVFLKPQERSCSPCLPRLSLSLAVVSGRALPMSPEQSDFSKAYFCPFLGQTNFLVMPEGTLPRKALTIPWRKNKINKYVENPLPLFHPRF